VNSTIKAIYHEKAFPSSTADIPTGSTFGIILDKTGFYAESGGQEYDQGSILIDGVAEFEVENVQAFNGYVVHIGQMKYGKFTVGEEVFSAYDEVIKFGIAPFVLPILDTFVDAFDPQLCDIVASKMADPKQPHRYPHPQFRAARSPRRPH
jgi:hypothetical protein